tara:strand:+ start:247 stop:843 length:597 start_codon:yes stop_codon:yes gene_type:complete
MNPSRETSEQHWLAFILLILGAAFLLVKSNVDAMGNFAPVMAFAFTGAIIMPKRLRILVPLALVMLTDLLLYGAGAFTHGFALIKYGLFSGAALWGASLNRQTSVVGTLGRVLGCSIVFYLVANTAAWLGSPAYAKSVAGWLQANTIGVPGYPPSWLFLRNAIVSDQLFSVVLLLAFNWESARKHLPVLPWISEPHRA